jgi:peptide deformylase
MAIIKISTDGGSTNIIQKKSLVPSNDPILKQKTPIFYFDKPTISPIFICNELIEIIKEYNGIGLAAPQIGYSHRVFVMGMGNEIVAFFNPELIEISKETELLPEGCLSFPDLYIKIRRPKTIKVKYQDYMGRIHEANFSGLTAKCFQHELDHLDGILFTDRAGPIALSMAKKKLEKAKK